jgi:hypothetical protein
MRSVLGSRLATLETKAGIERTGPAWWAVRKWLGYQLAPEQEAEAAAWASDRPAIDLAAPDMTGWSASAVRQWQGR